MYRKPDQSYWAVSICGFESLASNIEYLTLIPFIYLLQSKERIRNCYINVEYESVSKPKPQDA